MDYLLTLGAKVVGISRYPCMGYMNILMVFEAMILVA